MSVSERIRLFQLDKDKENVIQTMENNSLSPVSEDKLVASSGSKRLRNPPPNYAPPAPPTPVQPTKKSTTSPSQLPTCPPPLSHAAPNSGKIQMNSELKTEALSPCKPSHRRHTSRKRGSNELDQPRSESPVSKAHKVHETSCPTDLPEDPSIGLKSATHTPVVVKVESSFLNSIEQQSSGPLEKKPLGRSSRTRSLSLRQQQLQQKNQAVEDAKVEGYLRLCPNGILGKLRSKKGSKRFFAMDPLVRCMLTWKSQNDRFNHSGKCFDRVVRATVDSEELMSFLVTYSNGANFIKLRAESYEDFQMWLRAFRGIEVLKELETAPNLPEVFSPSSDKTLDVNSFSSDQVETEGSNLQQQQRAEHIRGLFRAEYLRAQKMHGKVKWRKQPPPLQLPRTSSGSFLEQIEHTIRCGSVSK